MWLTVSQYILGIQPATPATSPTICKPGNVSLTAANVSFSTANVSFSRANVSFSRANESFGDTRVNLSINH